MKNLGIYIHIPFCKQKCNYCDFISFPLNQDFQKMYVKELKKEISNFLEENKEINITSIYIGGGTPSYIDSRYIIEILEMFNFNKDIEVTIEINPRNSNSR